jgi:hypothetical protein
MTITARYAATCATCHQSITPGQKIEWSKGTPARHTTCAASAPSAPRPRADYRACDECGRAAAVVTAYDASGIAGRCCRRCAALPRYERSFA